ncbi:MAG: class I SAM-dependent methyltransferase, partial [Myxococcales bacterium]|nr:class I SAM-dependent methyltransferase [Myxococcales bacterium]
MFDRVWRLALDQMEQGRIPDAVIRAGIRRLLARRLAELGDDPVAAAERVEAHLQALAASPIAVATDAANAQHYEVPAPFFQVMLGPRRKYSACAWPAGVTTLAQAEDHSLAETLRRADVQAGQRVLELGCGWGSLSLFAAERLPDVRWVAVSNSASQRAYIEAEADRRGLGNLQVITADANTFAPPADAGPFDRVVSVEMFEHMRHWQALLARIHGWLKPGGRLFVHHFSHWQHPYLFEDRGEADWMSREFFSGGQMPYDRQLDRCQAHLRVERRWRWSGPDYSRTLEAWL